MKLFLPLKNRMPLVLLLINVCFSGLLFAQVNTFNGATNSNWGTPENWSLGVVPIAAHDVEIIGGKNVLVDNSSATCNSLTVTEGTVVVDGAITVVGNSPIVVAAAGTLTLENNASLVQSGYDGPNSGNIIVKRDSTPVIIRDYTYWSSPTTGTQTLHEFSPFTQSDKIITYYNGWKSTVPLTDTFTKGVGYAFYSPNTVSATVPTIVPYQFTGVPNNGDVDVEVVLGPDVESLRLVGNPYPSAIDADAFILANVIGIGTINQTISGVLSFWTHNHTLSGNSYSATDYAKYNLTGQLAVPTGTGNINVPSGFIASGQGFFAEVVADGNVSFRNDMRVETNNTNFYRTSQFKTSSAALEKHRIWLNLSNSTANISQTLVGYIQSATNGFDSVFDGALPGADSFVLYSFSGTQSCIIQGRALPFKDTDLVPLGYKIDVAGNATISIDHVDGLFLNSQKIYLEDQLLKVTHDLKQSPYTFSTQVGTFNNRFLLRYKNTSLGVNDFTDSSNAVTISSNNKQIKIKSEMEEIGQVSVFDVLGRLVFENKKVNKNEVLISDLGNRQALIVKILLINGQTVSKKIIY